MSEYDEKMKEITSDDFKELMDDSFTVDNISSMSLSELFESPSPSFFFTEAINDIQNAIMLFDKGFMVGGYGYLKSAQEILLISIYIFKSGEKEVRYEQFKNPKNKFINMIRDKELTDFSNVINEFASLKKMQENSDDRINKIRHKHSIRFFESVTRDGETKWQNERLINSITDTKYLISLFILTKIIHDPWLPIACLEEFESRLPDALAGFPTQEFTSKYLPEFEDTEFIKNSTITKSTYDEIIKMHEFTYDQVVFKAYHCLQPILEILDEDRKHFNDDELIVFDFYKKNTSGEVSQIILVTNAYFSQTYLVYDDPKIDPFSIEYSAGPEKLLRQLIEGGIPLEKHVINEKKSIYVLKKQEI